MYYPRLTQFCALALWCYVGSAASSQTPLPVSEWPAGTAARQTLPSERSLSYAFNDVAIEEIEGWLKWVGVELPVAASGQLTGWIWGQRSQSGWLNFAGYRLEGEITSPELTVEQWLFSAARLRFGYADGRWYVSRLQGRMRHALGQADVGNVRLAAQLETSGARALHVYGAFQGIHVGEFLSAFGVELDLSNAGGEMAIEATTQLAKATQLSGWDAQAKLQVSDLQLADLPPAELQAHASLNQGQWQLVESRLQWLDESFGLSGTGQLEEDLPFEMSLVGKPASLADTLRQLGYADVTARVDGQIDVRASVTGDAVRGLSRTQVVAESASLSAWSQQFTALKVSADLDGVERLRLQLESARTADGRLAGHVEWASWRHVVDGLPETVQLTLQAVDLSKLKMDRLPLELQGLASGSLTVAAGRHDDLWTWESVGDLQVQQFEAAGVRLGTSQLTWNKARADQQLTARVLAADRTVEANVVGQLAENATELSEQLQLVAYHANGDLRDFESVFRLSDVADDVIASTVRAHFDLAGTPQDWLQQGTAEVERADVEYRQQKVTLETAALQVVPSQFRLLRFRLVDQRGRVAGSAVIRRDQQGAHELSLRIADVQVAPYYQRLAAPSAIAVDGLLATEIRLRKNAGEPLLDQGWAGTFLGDLTELRVGGVPVGNLHAEGEIDQQQMWSQLSGTLLGGAVAAKAEVPLPWLSASAKSADTAAEAIRFEGGVDAASVERLLATLVGPRDAARYAGQWTVRGSGHWSPQDQLVFGGRMTLPRLTLDRIRLAEQCEVAVEYRDGKMLVEQLRGRVAGGLVNARGVLLAEAGAGGNRGELRFDAKQLELAQLLKMVFREQAPPLSGTLNYRGGVRFGRQMVVTGNAQAVDALVFGLPVQNARSDLRIDVDSASGRTQFHCRSISGTAIGGAFKGDLDISGSRRFELAVRGRVANGKLEQLSEALGFDHVVGRGQFDGQADLYSQDIASLTALSGKLQIDFENSDAQSVPILSELGPYVPLLQVASTDISGGTMHAQLGGGQLRIQDLLLNSKTFWLAAQGNASLLSGRLDIEAILQTGGGIEQQFSQSVLQKVAVGVVPQAALLAEINDLIQNRSLYFRIGGTTARPVIQAKPAQTIAKALLQNVQRQLLAFPVTTAGQQGD